MSNIAGAHISANGAAELAPLRAKSGWIIALGVVYVLAGLIALGSVVFATVVTVFVVGVMMLIAGVAEVINSFQIKTWGKFLLWLLLGVLYIVAGSVAYALVGVVIFFLAASFLLGREYFELAAMRFRSPAEAKDLRRAHNDTVFVAGMLIAAFVSIPVLNLATPLFGVALMAHMHKKVTHA